MNIKIGKMKKLGDKVLKKLKKKPDPVVNLAIKRIRKRVAT